MYQAADVFSFAYRGLDDGKHDATDSDIAEVE